MEELEWTADSCAGLTERRPERSLFWLWLFRPRTRSMAVTGRDGGLVKRGSSAFVSLCFIVMLSHQGCVHSGVTTRSEPVVVQAGIALVTYSPTLKAEIAVPAALGDEVARTAAGAAVSYLKGIAGPIAQRHLDEAVQKGLAAGLNTGAETGRQVTEAVRHELESFLREVVEKI